MGQAIKKSDAVVTSVSAPVARPATRHTVVRGIVMSILWLIFLVNAGVIVWLWLKGGGISAVHNVTLAFTSIGRITGLLSAYLLLVQVLLLARIPWLEQLIGFDKLTIWHRRNGKLALGLVLAHVVFITIGYAGTDRLTITKEATTLLTTYPGMIAATVGTLLMILTVATSLVIVRRRLRYEFWYLVHLTAYLGILLGWFHQIPTGNEFAVNGTAAAYWTAIYLATLGLLLVFRFAQPALATAFHRLRVAEVTVESADTVSVHITGKGLRALNARPGQFFLWRFLSRDRWWESHPFSLSAAPNDHSLRITAKALGDATRTMGSLKPGTLVVAEGPFGVFTDAVRCCDSAVLIAGGIGITPIRALLEELDGPVTLIYRVMRHEDILFRDEIDDLSRRHDITVHFLVGDHRSKEAAHLLSPAHLRQIVPDLNHSDFYICGPPAMVDALERSVRTAGVPRKHIHIERFAL